MLGWVRHRYEVLVDSAHRRDLATVARRKNEGWARVSGRLQIQSLSIEVGDIYHIVNPSPIGGKGELLTQRRLLGVLYPLG